MDDGGKVGYGLDAFWSREVLADGRFAVYVVLRDELPISEMKLIPYVGIQKIRRKEKKP